MSARQSKTGRTQTERRAESDRELFEAAIKLVAEHGGAVSLAQIGRQAGYSHALVGARFGSKAAFVHDLRDEIVEESSSQIVPREGAGAEETLRSILGNYLTWIGESGDRGRALYVLMTEAVVTTSDGRDTFAEHSRALRSALANLFREALADQKLPRGVTPESIAVATAGILRGVTLQYLLEGDEIDLKAARRTFDWILDLVVAKD